jgi:hypothetical protein
MNPADGSRDDQLQKLIERHIWFSRCRKLRTALLTLLLAACATTTLSLVRLAAHVSDRYKDKSQEVDSMKRERDSLQNQFTALQNEYNAQILATNQNKQNLLKTSGEQIGKITKLEGDLTARNSALTARDLEIRSLKSSVALKDVSIRDLNSQITAVRAENQSLREQLNKPVPPSERRLELSEFPPSDEQQHATIVLFCHLRDGYPMRDLARNSLQHFFVAHNYPSSMQANPLRKLAFAQFNGSFRKDRLLNPSSTFSIINLQDDSVFSAWFQSADTAASSADLNASSEELAACFGLLKPEGNPNTVSQLMLIVPGKLQCPNVEVFRCADRISVFQIALDGQNGDEWAAVCRQSGGLFQQFRIRQNSELAPEETWRLESSLQVWAERVMLSLPVTTKKGP